jgi:hypothetical protein
MEDITNRTKDINRRLDELNKKMDFNMFEIKKVNTTFKQIKHSYGVQEKNQETFAGKVGIIKMIQKEHQKIYFS